MKALKIVIVISLINFGALTGLIFGQAKTELSVESFVQNQAEAAVAEIPVVSVPNTDPISPSAVTQKTESPPTSTKPLASSPTATSATIAPKPSTAPPAAPPVVAAPKPQRCIVVIDGASYDVMQFKKIHSGGDIFRCGTDMTTIFYSQHSKQTLSQMQKYRI